jgi:hypothetical protein
MGNEKPRFIIEIETLIWQSVVNISLGEMTAINAIEKLMKSLPQNEIANMYDDDPIRNWFRPNETAAISPNETSPMMITHSSDNSSIIPIRKTFNQTTKDVNLSRSNEEGQESEAIDLPIEIHGECEPDATGSPTPVDGYKTIYRGLLDERIEHTIDDDHCSKRRRVEKGHINVLHV